MSFWSDPYLQNLHNKWINEKTWRMSWALSVAAATKTYSKPKLYTDDAGYDLLVKDYGLSFSEIDLSLNELKDMDARFTTLGKNYAIGKQDKPFIHLDYDAYLYESIPSETFYNGVMFLKEYFINLDDPKGMSPCHRPELFLDCKNVPEYWKEGIISNKFKIYQSGILGGSNIDFFKEYSRLIISIIKSNDTSVWDIIQSISEKEGPMFSGRFFTPRYTLDEYIPYVLSKKMKITPRLLVNGYNISVSRHSHVGYEKGKIGDLHGRITRRILNNYSSDAEKAGIKKDVKIPKITVLVIPTKDQNSYDTVLRSIIPRKLVPDEVIVSEYNLSPLDKGLISRLENVSICPGGNSYAESLKIAFKRSRGDLIIVLDGHIKTPKLYIEKSIASYLEYSDSVFCSLGNEYKDNASVMCGKKSILIEEKDTIDFPHVSSLTGGLYVLSKESLHDIFDLKSENSIQSIEDISTALKNNNYSIRCMKNLLVSHSNKIAVQ
jgi:hypothetical protein